MLALVAQLIVVIASMIYGIHLFWNMDEGYVRGKIDRCLPWFLGVIGVSAFSGHVIPFSALTARWLGHTPALSELEAVQFVIFLLPIFGLFLAWLAGSHDDSPICY